MVSRTERGIAMNAPEANRSPSPPSISEKAAYWDDKIVSWETSRYSLLARCNPCSWTVRSRMAAARCAVQEDFKRHAYVLDLGCGSGHLAPAVLNDPGRRYKGIDFSAQAIETARSRFALHSGRIQFEQLNVLEGSGWKAPLIVCLGLLDWLDYPEMRLLFSALDGESLCFSFTEADSGLAGLLYRQYRQYSDTAYRARNFPEPLIVETAESYGYRIDRIIRFSRLDPGRLVMASKR